MLHLRRVGRSARGLGGPHGKDLAGVRLELRAAPFARPVRLEGVQGRRLATPARHLQADGVLVANETEAIGRHDLPIGRRRSPVASFRRLAGRASRGPEDGSLVPPCHPTGEVPIMRLCGTMGEGSSPGERSASFPFRTLPPPVERTGSRRYGHRYGRSSPSSRWWRRWRTGSLFRCGAMAPELGRLPGGRRRRLLRWALRSRFRSRGPRAEGPERPRRTL